VRNPTERALLVTEREKVAGKRHLIPITRIDLTQDHAIERVVEDPIAVREMVEGIKSLNSKNRLDFLITLLFNNSSKCNRDSHRPIPRS